MEIENWVLLYIKDYQNMIANSNSKFVANLQFDNRNLKQVYNFDANKLHFNRIETVEDFLTM